VVLKLASAVALPTLPAESVTVALMVAVSVSQAIICAESVTVGEVGFVRPKRWLEVTIDQL